MEDIENPLGIINEESSSSKTVYRGIKLIPLIIGNETFERLGNLGSSSNFLVYFTTVFNMSSIGATNIATILDGSTNLATLPAAFLADTYFGRFNILAIASVASFMGMLLLALTAAIPDLHPPHCSERLQGATCVGPTPWQFIFLLGSLVLTVIGGGGIRTCNLAFGIDQFDPNDESSKRQITKFFNWYYLSYTTALMIAVTVIMYVQTNVSWAIGLAIPAGMMAISCLLFFAGNRLYVKVKPVGSPLLRVIQVIVAAIRKRNLKLCQESKSSLFDHVPAKSTYHNLPTTNQFRFLEKAAVITGDNQLNVDGTTANPWELCSMQQVEQVKCLTRIVPIWFSMIIYFVFVNCVVQIYIVFQALQTDRHVGRRSFQVPAASLVAFSMLAITVFLPLYDRVIVPPLRRITKHGGGITMLQRIGIGMAIAVQLLCCVP